MEKGQGKYETQPPDKDMVMFCRIMSRQPLVMPSGPLSCWAKTQQARILSQSMLSVLYVLVGVRKSKDKEWYSSRGLLWKWHRAAVNTGVARLVGRGAHQDSGFVRIHFPG